MHRLRTLIFLSVAAMGIYNRNRPTVGDFQALYAKIFRKRLCVLILLRDFLADCTNGRAYATVLRPSSVCRL